MIDNIDVAVFCKVNELAERYGLKPYDFVASFAPNGVEPKPDEDHHFVLAFDAPANGSATMEKRFDKMLDAIGIGDDLGLSGTEVQIIDALDKALAPRQGGSGRISALRCNRS